MSSSLEWSPILEPGLFCLFRPQSRTHYKWNIWLTNQKKEFYKLINPKMLQTICSITLIVPLSSHQT